MCYDLLAGIIVGLAYLAGALIYFGTKDECIPFARKHQKIYNNLSNVFYLMTIITAAIAGWLITTAYKEFVIALFVVPVIQMSICSVNRKHKEVLAIAVKAALLFTAVLFLINFVASSHFFLNF